MDYSGKDQSQRFLDALDPSYVEINEFTLMEWLEFAYQFASRVNYFRGENDEVTSGDWKLFFEYDDELDNVPPHLALFICFIWLLEFSKKRLNKLTHKHLDFYYREVLQLQKLTATPDRVHLIFELAKSATEARIDKGARLDGGKDEAGRKRVYELVRESIINQAGVSKLKNVYHDADNALLKAGEVLPEESGSQWPFGSPLLENAKLGFALASPVLAMKEGHRTVQFEITFMESLHGMSAQTWIDHIEIWCSGEKGWLGPYALEPGLTRLSDSLTHLNMGFTIPKEDAPVTPYNSRVHGEQYNTDQPICRLMIRTGNRDGYELYRRLSEKGVKSLSIHIDVQGISDLILENDVGVLNGKKPFYPFGTRPVKRSNFYVDYPELFAKKWENIHVHIAWKNTPEVVNDEDAFKEHYYAYRRDHLGESSTYTYLFALYSLYVHNDDLEKPSWGPLTLDPANLLVKGADHFKADIEIKHKEDWETTSDGRDMPLFLEEDTGFASDFSVPNHHYDKGNTGPLRLSLNQTFYHELYPRIYALSFASDKKDTLIPKEPYTPMIETISLGYTASESLKEHVQLFHEHPFGQSHESPAPPHLPTLVPMYPEGGALYIGLKGAEPTHTISLLIHLLEGSEDPEADTVKRAVKWSVLCNDHWKPLDSDYMIVNEVGDFLQSGLVVFTLPKEASRENSLLEPGINWLRAEMRGKYNATSKILSVQAQSSLARLVDQGLDWEHVQHGLPANSITKWVDKAPLIKKVMQPYPSFGGKPSESDKHFHRRVSERLRHKNRAITIWDYERLVLEQFPEIYKVKGVHHTTLREKKLCHPAPGHVVVVVIPDMVNQHMYDVYQPRVSRAKLNEIEEFLNERNGMQVNALVTNPTYEEVLIDLHVKFHKGYDESYHVKKLNEDITRALSPHAYRVQSALEFGTHLHRSTIVHWVEQLDYVDWVKEVEIFKEGDRFAQVAPSNPISILVSAKEHRITLV